jgi:DNA-binding transcriptional regulator GbsR (MarR family)
MTIVGTILTALARATAPITLGDLSQQIAVQNPAIDKAKVSRSVTKLMYVGRVSCSKKPGVRRVTYFLTAAQLEMFSKGATRPPTKQTPKTHPPRRQLFAGVTAADLSSRLRFLNDISARPAFVGHARLIEIIDDYRRALNRATQREDQKQ